MIDIQVNDLITTRNGKRYLVIEMGGDLFGLRLNGFTDLGSYNSQGRLMNWAGANLSGLDVMEIRRPESPSHFMESNYEKVPIVYTRVFEQPTKEMTITEISEALGCKVKVVG